jgi:hypothetical protein
MKKQFARTVEEIAASYTNALLATGTRRINVRVIDKAIFIDGTRYNVNSVVEMTKTLRERRNARGYAAR